MSRTATLVRIALVASGSLILLCQAASAADYSGLITEESLRARFTFGGDDQLKFSLCKKKTYPTCTYVWGPESKKDATRIKMGLAPSGSKLQLVYAEADSAKDFERVLASYGDAETVPGLGKQAVWSDKRGQLSLITDGMLIIHIHIEDEATSDPRGTAISVAQDVLAQL